MNLTQRFDEVELAGAKGVWSAVAATGAIYALGLGHHVSLIGVLALAVGYSGRMVYVNFAGGTDDDF